MKKQIIVGVTGGIACYKALDIVSKLKKRDMDVTVIMTRNAAQVVDHFHFIYFAVTGHT